MKNLLTYLFLVLTFVNCKKNDSPAPPPEIKPQIASLSSSKASYNSSLIIRGKGFGNSDSGCIVTVNTKPATIQNWTDTAVSIVIPERAGSGPVRITTPKGATTGPDLEYVPVVYVSGYETLGNDFNQSLYWVDGRAYLISANSVLNSIWVSGSDIYVAGSVKRTIYFESMYWANGLARLLPTSGLISGNALAICKKDNDIYCVGTAVDNATGLTKAMFWKNSVPTIMINSSSDAVASSLSVVDNDVYVAGNQTGTTSNGLVWKNGIQYPINFGSTTSSITAVCVSDGDVYAAGSELKGTHNVARYWKNGVGVDLTDGTEATKATGIYVTGKDVYVCGVIDNRGPSAAVYWKNGVKTSLTDGLGNATTTGIQVLGNDIFVVGRDNNAAVYWKNGTKVSLVAPESAVSTATSIFLQ